MVSKRDRILNFINYIESLGIEVNFNKNKARGNKGFFKAIGVKYRIDISKGLTEDEQLSVLLHEFAHYIHYSYDKNLQNLEIVKTVSSLKKKEICPLSISPLTNLKKSE